MPIIEGPSKDFSTADRALTRAEASPELPATTPRARSSPTVAGASGLPVDLARQTSVARRKRAPQPIRRCRQLCECGPALLFAESSDQAGDGERAPELPGEIENRNCDGGDLRVALAEGHAIAPLLHRPCFGAFAIRVGHEHMGAGAGVERQFGAFVEVMARRLRGIGPNKAHAGAPLTDIE